MPTRTNRYLEYLDQQTPIAPANSQEELQEAKNIEAFFLSRGLETTVQEFDASAAAPNIRAIMQVILLVGILLSHIGNTLLSVIAMFMTLAAAALLIMDTMGKDIFTRRTPPAKSQNVVGVHRASGPLVSKGNRPIVIVAHYDTPYENFLFNPAIAKAQPYIRIAAVWSVPIVAFCVIFQPFAMLGSFRALLWVVGILAGIAPCCVGVAKLAEHHLGCTTGANDNKSSIAALFDIAATIHPTEEEKSNAFQKAEDTSLDEAETNLSVDENTSVPEPQPRYEEVIGARHGEEVLRKLGIVPASCEVEYVEPKIIEYVTPEANSTSAAFVTDAMAKSAGGNEELLSDDGIADGYEQPNQDAGKTTRLEIPVAITDFFSRVKDFASSKMHHPAPSDVPMVEAVEDNSHQAEEVLTEENSVVDTTAEDTILAPALDQETIAQNTTSPSRTTELPDLSADEQVNLARRVSLFDLPDPSHAEVDPLSPEGVINEHIMVQDDEVVVDTTVKTSNEAPALSLVEDVSAPNPVIPAVSKLSADVMHPASKISTRKKLRLFGKKRQNDDSLSDFLGVNEDFNAKTDGNKIGSWDNFDTTDEESKSTDSDNPETPWKGGATRNSLFQVIEGDANENSAESEEQHEEKSVPTDEELRDAVLSMSDDELLSHDIWLVALGSSALDHAGMTAFLQDYRRSCRGSFVINLDSIGAGQLTMYTNEGAYNNRRADRRLARLLTTTANDLHIDLAKTTHRWGDTDATKAMRSSMRSVTLAGVDEKGLPALSHTADDVIEEVDPRQIKDVSTLICELIRRS
ncbi:M28 family peptidase [Atopobium fossor]|uniref:M28 family peptidase n=1 Tax=Atopobium fossor TaxID=39487 RepID=UPI00041B4A09|nr:M28 family peptidase [Atopobium fossor]